MRRDPLVVRTKESTLELLKMNTFNPETPKFATVHEVVMNKLELIVKLVENKAKHDVVLATAIEGYWDTARDRIEEKKKLLQEQVTNWQEDANREFSRVLAKIDKKEMLPNSVSLSAIGINTSLGLAYPQDHSQDYERAIDMMKASIYDTVSLSADEFDAYVRNNWEWKKNFLDSNAAYVTTIRSKYNRVASVKNNSIAITGDSVGVYEKAAQDVAASYRNDGVNLSNF